jgi:hypothetical protein
MKLLLLIPMLFLGLSYAEAQHVDGDLPIPQKKDTIKPSFTKIYTLVDKVPEFPGGLVNWRNFLKKNLRHLKVPGYEHRVIVAFIVERDGSIKNIEVVRSLSPKADREAIRLTKISPKWTPGILNGYRVRVQYAIPIQF